MEFCISVELERALFTNDFIFLFILSSLLDVVLVGISDYIWTLGILILIVIAFLEEDYSFSIKTFELVFFGNGY